MNLPELKKEIIAFSEEIESSIISIRRELHKNPELSFKETNTHKFLSAKLAEIGITNQKRIAGNGIVALIEGRNKTGKTFGLRADMDALPVKEKTGLEFESQNDGIMHACGHDVHMSCLLGAAKILYNLRDKINGNIKLIFQPAEEKIPGGALQMIREGALENPDVDAMLALHVMPELEAGTVGIKGGMYMASSDEVYITVRGRGGHAAMPDIIDDSVAISAQLIVNLQQVVSRLSPPSLPCVLSFGKVIANGANNIIPAEVKIDGTFRTMNEEWRDKAHTKIREIAAGMALATGVEIDVEILKGYPFLQNDIPLADFCRNSLTDLLGKEKVQELELRMTAEDFAYFTLHCPSVLFRLGTGNNEFKAPLHSPFFRVDESAIKKGMQSLAWIAASYLNS